MPLFYFHYSGADGRVEDEDGRQCPDFEAAWRKAIADYRDTVAGDVCQGRIDFNAVIEIEDEQRRLIDTICFPDAVRTASTTPVPPRGQR